MDIEGIAAICAIFVGQPWVLLHYITKWKTAATLTSGDETLLEELYLLARRLLPGGDRCAGATFSGTMPCPTAACTTRSVTKAASAASPTCCSWHPPHLGSCGRIAGGEKPVPTFSRDALEALQ